MQHCTPIVEIIRATAAVVCENERTTHPYDESLRLPLIHAAMTRPEPCCLTHRCSTIYMSPGEGGWPQAQLLKLGGQPRDEALISERIVKLSSHFPYLGQPNTSGVAELPFGCHMCCISSALGILVTPIVRPFAWTSTVQDHPCQRSRSACLLSAGLTRSKSKSQTVQCP